MNPAVRIVNIPAFPESPLYIFLYKDVKNVKDIMKKLYARELDCSLIDPLYIIDSFQLEIVALKSMTSNREDTIQTSTLHSEMVFNISGSHHISKSFSTFGIKKKSKNIIVMLFPDLSQLSVDDIINLVDGTLVDFSELNTVNDIEKTKQIYKITDLELEHSTLIDSIVTRIAAGGQKIFS
eukprot:TRINITY_DN303_c0_g1_i1.p1 TRINITY_DN303_c0_g1~~TRINITY_DN303_c0_g1_i1.p1  ORF type:complete len:181 (+),score=35.63 TRINITY_DN303_c0_g1_i1:102-644(+)